MKTGQLSLGMWVWFFSFAASSMELDAGKVQAVIREGMEALHVTLESITCPMAADYTVGHTVTCVGTDNEETQSEFTVRIDSAKVNWTSEKKVVAIADQGPILTKLLSSKLGKPVTVTCADKYLFRKDHCEVTCNGTIDGKDRLVLVKSCPDKNGDMKYLID